MGRLITRRMFYQLGVPRRGPGARAVRRAGPDIQARCCWVAEDCKYGEGMAIGLDAMKRDVGETKAGLNGAVFVGNTKAH